MKKNFFLLFSMLALSTSVLADGPYLVDGIDVKKPDETTNAGKAAKLTCTTDADGCVVITLSKYVEGNGETNFRDVGMHVDGFKYNGEHMYYYFNPIYPQDGNVMKWVPISPADVQCGGLIEFNMHGENKEIMFNVGSTGSYSKASFQYSYGAISATNNTGCISSWPQNLSEYCDAMISVYNDRNKMDYSAYITWETIANGNVEIRISDYGENTGTHFDGNGLASEGFTMKNAEGEALTFSDYFDKTPASSGTIYTLVKKQEVPAGAKIIFNENRNKNINWIAKSNGFGYNHYRFAYTYGTTCSTFPTPVITSVSSEGVITFNEVAGATHYTVRVYYGSDLMYTQENITSGETIHFAPYLTATYTVKLQAFDGEDGYSDESAGFNWSLTGDLANLPTSNVCYKLLRQDAITASDVYISISTDDSDGSFYITMQPDNAAFRGNEYIVEDGLKYNGEALTTYFTRTLLDGADNKYKTIKYTPKDRDDVQYGINITFNMYSEGKQLAWFDRSGTSRNSPNLSFSYIYGTTCTLALDEVADNTAVIAANNGRTLDARLGRSFVGGDNFYSLCLPFGLSAAQLTEVFGNGYVLGEMQNASNANDVVTFEMGTASSVEAGKPYIIRPTQNAANPLFRGVTIDADASTSVSFGGIAGMRGFYAPSVAGENEWFLGAANTLYQNSDNSASNAFRAFFQVQGGSPLNAPRIRMLPQTATGMETVQNGPAQEVRKVLRDGEVYILRNGAAYTVFGQRVY